jgi:galactokinase/mevalonate kinase-like predicted kinase
MITKTPITIDLIGGVTTDPHYSEFNDSIVLSSAVNMYTEAKIQSSHSYIFESKDKRFEKSFHSIQEIRDLYNRDKRLLTIPYLRLHIATVLYMMDNFNFDIKPFYLSTTNPLPFNSGLGGSSSLTISILKSLLDYFNFKYTPDFLAQHSFAIKKDFLKDYCCFANNYGAAHGCFSVIKRTEDRITCSPYFLNDSAELLAELKGSTVLIYNQIKEQEFIKNSADASVNIALINQAYKQAEQAIVKAKRKQDITYLLDSLRDYWKVKNAVYQSYSASQKLHFDELLGLGFTGGKICGFHSNFYLMTVNPEEKNDVLLTLPVEYECIDFEFLT